MFTDFRVLFSAAEKRMDYRAGWPDDVDAGTVRMSDLFATAGSDTPSKMD